MGTSKCGLAAVLEAFGLPDAMANFTSVSSESNF